MEFRLPAYNRHGTIDCEINHPVYGWIPTTLQPDDAETSALYEEVLAAGNIDAYVAPSPEEARANLAPLTRRQFRLGMRQLNISTDSIAAAINAIPDDADREIALIEWEEADGFDRMHPLVISLTGAFGLQPIDVDAMWTAVSTV